LLLLSLRREPTHPSTRAPPPSRDVPTGAQPRPVSSAAGREPTHPLGPAAAAPALPHRCLQGAAVSCQCRSAATTRHPGRTSEPPPSFTCSQRSRPVPTPLPGRHGRLPSSPVSNVAMPLSSSPDTAHLTFLYLARR
jgi:hypothetical protein